MPGGSNTTATRSKVGGQERAMSWRDYSAGLEHLRYSWLHSAKREVGGWSGSTPNSGGGRKLLSASWGQRIHSCGGQGRSGGEPRFPRLRRGSKDTGGGRKAGT